MIGKYTRKAKIRSGMLRRKKEDTCTVIRDAMQKYLCRQLDII